MSREPFSITRDQFEGFYDIVKRFADQESYQKYTTALQEIMNTTETRLIEQETLKRKLTSEEVEFLKFAKNYRPRVGRELVQTTKRNRRFSPYKRITDNNGFDDGDNSEDKLQIHKPTLDKKTDSRQGLIRILLPTLVESLPSSVGSSASSVESFPSSVIGPVREVKEPLPMRFSQAELVQRFDRMKISEFS